ncbi:MAG: hypothetical protein IIB00_00600 [candidate division Zixibacteria bacterium]|nr:hypothetical protein [candidate division Zixibacteria bacterium]
MKRFLTTFLLALLWAFQPAVAGSFIPIGEPGSEIFYLRAKLNQTLGLNNYFDYQLAPQAQDSITRPDGSISYWSSEIESLRTYLFYTQRFNSEQKRRLQFFEAVRAGISVNLSPKLSVMSSFVLDDELANDPTYKGKVWRGLAGDVETGSLYYRTSKFDLLFGRHRASWGPTYTNLLLSQTSRPLDGLAFRYRLGERISFSYRLARLDGFPPASESSGAAVDSGVFVNRYMAGHRLDWNVSKSIRLGFFESIIFAGPGRSLELQFLNPFIFFHANQLNEGNNDNTFLGIDFDILPRDGIRFFGQLFVDDFQIEKKTQGDEEPDEIGFLLGAHLVSASQKWEGMLRWDRVYNRTYNQKVERNRYILQGKPIGHPQGNDFEMLQATLRRWLNKETYAELTGRIIRQGEAKIIDTWAEPWLDVVGQYSEPFPTGVVEKTTEVALTLHSLFALPLSRGETRSDDRLGLAKVTIGWKKLRNIANVASLVEDQIFVHSSISIFLAQSHSASAH